MYIPKTSNSNNIILKILVIDDEKTFQDSLIILLSSFFRCHVMTADNGEEGIELAIKYKFNLILSDIDLPDISGINVVYSIRRCPTSKNKNTPIIIVSGNLLVKEHYPAIGVNAFIDKVSVNEKLKNILKELGFL